MTRTRPKLPVSDAPLYLPRFAATMRGGYAADVPLETARRYINGDLPAFGRYLVENIELLEALLEDARALHAEKRQSEASA